MIAISRYLARQRHEQERRNEWHQIMSGDQQGKGGEDRSDAGNPDNRGHAPLPSESVCGDHKKAEHDCSH